MRFADLSRVSSKTAHLPPWPRARNSSSALKSAIVLFGGVLCLIVPGWLHAANISGTVKDQSGAVIAGAHVEITGADLAQPVVLLSDGVGKFVSPDLKPGSYSVRVTKDGFEAREETVDLRETAEIQITLAIARQQVGISVTGKALANSDPVYRQLRDIGLGRTFRFDNMNLAWDVGSFHFEKGTLTVLRPVDGVVTGAIFVGQGKFHLKPLTVLDLREMNRRIGSEEVDEEFTEVVFRFTGDQRMQFLAGMNDAVEPPAAAGEAFNHWKEKVRKRQEFPISFSEQILEGETMDNVDADVLAAVYNPAHPPFLNAYIHGVKRKDLRFFVRTRVGALPQMDSPEEVALVNFDPEGLQDGVWYLSHLKSEYMNRTARSDEDRRLFATRHYKIETVIAKNGHLFSSATIGFEPLVPGERIMKFGLLPNLRVSRVLDDQGQSLQFIQESRKEDGSFYAILPAAPPQGKESSITVEYAGDKVLEQAGEGSYYVRARTAWYPNLNGFGEHSLYDLTFKVPRKYKVISVGALQSESVEDDLAVSRWTTPVPVAVAGFNYGEYQKVELADDITGYKIAGYYLTEFARQVARHSGRGHHGASRHDKLCARADAGSTAVMHPFLRKDPLRPYLDYRAARFRVRPILAEPGLPAHFRLPRLDRAMDAVWPH
jgi:hypothetical protein